MGTHVLIQDNCCLILFSMRINLLLCFHGELQCTPKHCQCRWHQDYSKPSGTKQYSRSPSGNDSNSSRQVQSTEDAACNITWAKSSYRTCGKQLENHLVSLLSSLAIWRNYGSRNYSGWFWVLRSDHWDYEFDVSMFTHPRCINSNMVLFSTILGTKKSNKMFKYTCVESRHPASKKKVCQTKMDRIIHTCHHGSPLPSGDHKWQNTLEKKWTHRLSSKFFFVHK